MAMTKTLKNLLSGAGSVFDIAPSEDYSAFLHTESTEQRIRGYWQRTGQHIQTAINQYDEQQEQEQE